MVVNENIQDVGMILNIVDSVTFDVLPVGNGWCLIVGVQWVPEEIKPWKSLICSSISITY